MGGIFGVLYGLSASGGQLLDSLSMFYVRTKCPGGALIAGEFHFHGIPIVACGPQRFP